MKPNQKQKLIAEKAILDDKLNSILEKIGKERIYQFITDDLDNDLEYLDAEIEEEQSVANENRVGAYRSEGTEARKRVKYLKGVKKKHKQLAKMFNDFLKMKAKLGEL